MADWWLEKDLGDWWLKTTTDSWLDKVPGPLHLSGTPASSPLAIDTYDLSDETVHPSVVYFKNAWNGHKWWMAITPYPADATKENPSIYFSDDGVTWDDTGITNPIEPFPGGDDHNADTELLYNPSDDKLYCYWTLRDPGNAYSVKVKSSSDGVTWANEATCISLNEAVEGAASPAVILDDDGVYKMWVNDYVANPNNFNLYTCSTPNGTFTFSKRCKIWNQPGEGNASGREIWHQGVTKIGDYYYALLNFSTVAVSGTGTSLNFAVSRDGVNWYTQDDFFLNFGDVAWSESPYRGVLVEAEGKLWCYYSGYDSASTFGFARSEITMAANSDPKTLAYNTLAASAELRFPLDGTPRDFNGVRGGTWSGTAAYTKFKGDRQGVLLDGTNSITVPAYAPTDTTFTLSFWWKKTENASGAENNILWGRNQMGAFSFNHTNADFREVLIWKYNTTLWNTALDLDGVIGEWVHYAAVFDSVNDTVTLYRNGVVYGTPQTMGTIVWDGIAFGIGKQGAGTQAPAGIAECMYFGRPLTASEVTTLYNYPTSKPSRPKPLDDTRTTLVMHPGVNVFQERTGALNTLTPAEIGDVVGTWADTTGTYIFRAPSDAARLTRTVVDGKSVLERTATGQYYVSDDAASTWTWLHNGTAWSFAACGKPTTLSGSDSFDYIATTNSSSAQIGVDLRSSGALFGRTVVHVPTGVGSTQACFLTAEDGNVAGKWQEFVALVDPDHGTQKERINFYSFGRKSQDNSKFNAPVASAPTNTLHLCGLAGGAGVEPLGYYGPMLLYQGTWSEDEIEEIEKALDYGKAGRAKLGTAPVTISQQTVPYETFPKLFRMPNGDLLANWRAGIAHTADNTGKISQARSTDNGATWTVTNNVLTDPGARDMREAPGVVTRQNGFIVATTCTDWGGTNLPANCKVWRSIDNGVSYTLISTIGIQAGYDYAPFAYGRFHELADGTILMTAYCKKTSDGLDYPQLWESTDAGVTWSMRSELSSGRNEWTMTNTGGTNWVALMRRSDHSYLDYSTSTDDGLTWTVAANSTLNNNNLSPDSFKVGNTIYCAVTDRSGSTGIKLATWANGRPHIGSSSWFVKPWNSTAATNTDIGYPSVVVEGQTVHMVAYDEDAASPGTYYTKFTLPKHNG